MNKLAMRDLPRRVFLTRLPRTKLRGTICASGVDPGVFNTVWNRDRLEHDCSGAQYPDDRYNQDRNRSDNGDQNRRGRDWDRYGNYGGSSELAALSRAGSWCSLLLCVSIVAATH